MKKQLKIAALAATLALGAASAQGVELADNGDFETGDFAGWQQFLNGGTQMISTFNPSTGTFAANLTANGGPFNTLIKNANVGIGIVNPGDEITITFDARGSTADGGVAFAEFFTEIDGGGTSSAEILGGAPLALNADASIWTSFSFTTTVGPDASGGVTLQLLAACGAAASCVSDIYFDNVSISAVPVPAAVWLFGSALGMLGFGARRKK
ncbi:MAG: hypothetical protein AB8G16_16245 [Gammaproteobacteria bacterium]